MNEKIIKEARNSVEMQKEVNQIIDKLYQQFLDLFDDSKVHANVRRMVSAGLGVRLFEKSVADFPDEQRKPLALVTLQSLVKGMLGSSWAVLDANETPSSREEIIAQSTPTVLTCLWMQDLIDVCETHLRAMDKNTGELKNNKDVHAVAHMLTGCKYFLQEFFKHWQDVGGPLKQTILEDVMAELNQIIMDADVDYSILNLEGGDPA